MATMEPVTDTRPRVKCPHCAELILEDATVCRFCNRSVKTAAVPAAKPDENLAQAMLFVPLVGCMLIWFWIGSMNLLQGPMNSLMLVGLGTILVTAALAHADAKKLGMGVPGDPHKGPSPTSWFAVILLLWIVGYPLYLYRRKAYGAKSYVAAALLLALVFAGSLAGTASAISAQQEKIRSILGH